MAMFNEACEISAKYDPNDGGVSITIMGKTLDIFKLLTTLANQIAESSKVSTERLFTGCLMAAPLMRSAEGTKYEVSPDVIKKAKERRDG